MTSKISSYKAVNHRKLSICIATYNRADFIGETLKSIIPQLNDEVEVVIADGASTDSTSFVVNQIAKDYQQIRYILLPSKGGVDQDYCKAVEFAEAEMCWLFTDDDLIKPGAINRLLHEISKGYSLIVVNAEVKNVDFTKTLQKNQIKIESDRVFYSGELDNLFQCVIPYVSFIGAVVINKKLWLERDKEIFFGTEFIHVGVIFQKPVPGNTLVIAEPLITIRLGNAQWTSRSFEIWMIKWPKLLCSFADISETSKKEHSMSPSWQWLIKMLYHRKQSAFSQKQYRVWLKSAKDLPAWWILTVKAISLFPVPIAKFMINSYVSLRNKIT